MPQFDNTEIDEQLTKQLDSLIAAGERIVVRREGRAVAALVSVEDLEMLEKLEDKLDAEEAERLLNDPTQTPIPYEQIREELGFE